jgi:23S rRNA pseudouridine1911/1915/1917 synthase
MFFMQMPAQKLSVDYNASADATKPIELRISPDHAGQRLDQALSQLLPGYSRSRLQQWIRDGHVTVDGGPAQPRLKLRGGEAVRIAPQAAPEVLEFTPEALPLTILYEDESILIVDKPAGLVVHPGSGNWHGTLLNALLAHAATLAQVPRAGIVHRLDKDTSGVLAVAKTLTAQTSLVRQLQARSVHREYFAVARGSITRGGTVDAPIGRHRTQRTRMAVVAGGRAAVTHYAVVAHNTRATLLRCRLETGRTHQIRVHLQSIGHPLVGDPAYGRRTAGVPAFARQALHAARLALIHPASGKPMSWQSPLPADMRELLAALELPLPED